MFRLLHLQPRPVSGKDPHIRRFLDDFVSGLARSMTRARLDADEVWLGADIRSLERGDMFEGLSWYHPIAQRARDDRDKIA
jgi:hypothetical protein